LPILVIGQPTLADAWNRNTEKQAMLAEGEAFASAHELSQAYYDPLINLVLLDVRDERDYNLYHLENARRVDPNDIHKVMKELLNESDSPVVIVMSNDETRAIEVWKQLVAKNTINAYILEGGINGWIEEHAADQFQKLPSHPDDTLAWVIPDALGDRWESAIPHQPHEPGPYEYEHIKLQKKAPAGAGGCG